MKIMETVHENSLDTSMVIYLVWFMAHTRYMIPMSTRVSPISAFS